MMLKLERENLAAGPVTVKGIFDALRQGGRFIRKHPYLVLCLALAMAALGGAKNREVIPLFASQVNLSNFALSDAVIDLVALGWSLYVTYKWLPILGLGAMLLFLVAQIPHLVSEVTRDFPNVVHALFTTCVGIVGIRLMARMRQAIEVAQRRQQEIAASAELTAKALNERVHLLEKSARQEQRMASLLRVIDAVSQAKSPLEIARESLALVAESVASEYSSLTLVRIDGSLGERVESFHGMKPFFVSPRRGGLAEAMLNTGQVQYVDNAETDPRANPDLVKAGIRSYLGLPLLADGRMRGILFLHSRRPHAFLEERQFLESIVQVMAMPLLRAERAA